MIIASSTNSQVPAANVGDLVIWCAALLVVMVAAGVVLVLIHRKYRYRAGIGDAPAAFDIEALESMLTDGQVSLEEYRVLRRLALNLDIEARSGDNASSSTGGNGDDESDKGDGQTTAPR